jgi:hypothetical protein
VNNAWIMFFRGGETVIDICIGMGDDQKYPYGRYYITPRYGQVTEEHVIEIREPKND